MPQEVMNIIISAVSTVVLALAGWGVERLIAWLNSKIKDEKAKKFANDILGIVTNAVKQIYQEFVEVLKNEGKFGAEQQAEAKEKALEIINTQLTEEMKNYVKENGQDITTYLSNLVESVIYSLKNSK